jgi:ABC-type bacteriocin/lantibiotic exporter with double-glycine peptidase domain
MTSRRSPARLRAVLLLSLCLPVWSHAATSVPVLAVPALRQTPERCGPAALAMVLRYYGAGAPAFREADAAYSPALHGTLITDLATAARRGGHAATVATLEEDSLRALVRDSLPPILLYQVGSGPITRPHYGVVVGWDPARERYYVLDGGEAARPIARRDLLRRWRAAGGQALVVLRTAP